MIVNVPVKLEPTKDRDFIEHLVFTMCYKQYNSYGLYEHIEEICRVVNEGPSHNHIRITSINSRLGKGGRGRFDLC